MCRKERLRPRRSPPLRWRRRRWLGRRRRGAASTQGDNELLYTWTGYDAGSCTIKVRGEQNGQQFEMERKVEVVNT